MDPSSSFGLPGLGLLGAPASEVVLEPSGWSNGVQQPYPAHQQHQHQHQQQHQRGDSLEELLGLLPRHLLISPTQCNAGDPQLADALARRAADNGCATTKGLLALHQAKLMRSNRGFSDAALEDGAPRTDKRLVGGNTRSVIEYLSARGAAALAAAAAAAAATEASLKQSDTAESAGLDQSWQATTSGSLQRPSSATYSLPMPLPPPALAPLPAALPAPLPSQLPMLPHNTFLPMPSLPSTDGTPLHGGSLQPLSLGSCGPLPPAIAGAGYVPQPLMQLPPGLAHSSGLPLSSLTPSVVPPDAPVYGPPSSSAMAAMAMAAFGWAASGGHAPPPCMLRSGAAAGPFTPKSLAAAHSAMQYAQDAAASCEAANGFGRPGCTGSGLGEAGSGSTGVFQGPTPPAPSISRNLWLGNVMVADSETVARTFRKFGPIESVRVFAGRTYAFVNFHHEAHAAAAKAALEMQVLPELTSAAPLLVRFQVPPESIARRA